MHSDAYALQLSMFNDSITIEASHSTKVLSLKEYSMGISSTLPYASQRQSLLISDFQSESPVLEHILIEFRGAVSAA